MAIDLSIPSDSNRTSLIIFDFDGEKVSAVSDEFGNPWFVATNICKILGYSNTSQVLTDNIQPEDKAYITVEKGAVVGGISTEYVQSAGTQTLVINESGLYVLILGSRKPDAKRFKQWLALKVLPDIHRTGAFFLQNLSPAEVILRQAERLVAHERQLASHDRRIGSLEARADARDEWSKHYTVIGYCNLRGLQSPTQNQAVSWGKRSTALSRKRGIAIGKTTDPRYGAVGTYHISILDEIIGDGSKKPKDA